MFKVVLTTSWYHDVNGLVCNNVIDLYQLKKGVCWDVWNLGQYATLSG